MLRTYPAGRVPTPLPPSRLLFAALSFAVPSSHFFTHPAPLPLATLSALATFALTALALAALALADLNLAALAVAALTLTLAALAVGTLNDEYIRRVPLPQAPWIQSTDHVTCNVTITCDAINTCYLGQVPRIPTWHDLSRLIASVARTTILPFLPVWLI
jgi:hypothetical protein